jgi:hypothetical protein
MEYTPQSIDSERIKQTIRILPYEEAKEGVFQLIEKPIQENSELNEWDLSFSKYVEEHKNSKLLFCWYAKDLGVVFSPSDQNGIWVLVGEGINSKGTLPKFTIGALERIAKEKGLL